MIVPIILLALFICGAVIFCVKYFKKPVTNSKNHTTENSQSDKSNNEYTPDVDIDKNKPIKDKDASTTISVLEPVRDAETQSSIIDEKLNFKKVENDNKIEKDFKIED